MGRRRKSTADDIMEIASLMPWWVGVALAIVSYFVLHAIAVRPVVIDPKAPSHVGILFKGLATAGQYFVPILLLAGAVASALRRRRATELVAAVRERNDAQALNDVSWREFEVLVAEAFRLQGYQVQETGGGGADGGVDLVLTRHREKHLVQCKQWKAYKVGVEIVRELYGLMSAHGAAGGFVVTSGTFTQESQRFAEGRNVQLIDGAKLNAMLELARAARPGSAPSATRQDAGLALDPQCPRCGNAMARRVAKRGANAGSIFWGCVSYPECRGTRPVD
jgi:restriction system protein